jgi:hypothetical protein
MFNFRQSKFNRKYNTGNILIEKPKPQGDDAVDCNDESVENRDVRNSCFLNTDSCTYVIKGGCLAPGFHTKWDNTMTSANHVDI